MSNVTHLKIYGSFWNEVTDKSYDLTYGFELLPAQSEDKISDDICAKFQEQIESDNNRAYSLDFSGSQDPITLDWEFGFDPCNLTDDPGETYKTARIKVKQLTEEFRELVISCGIKCGKMRKY